MPVDEIYMNNTKTLAILAVLTAATLVIGVTFAATPSAFAAKKKDSYSSTDPGNDNQTRVQKKDQARDGGNDGNTVTEQSNKQKGIQSGWDNEFEQEGTNLICTHPESTCLSTD
jgi:hypothetical protein